MSVFASILKNLTNFLQDHHVSFSNGILILLTLGGEQIFKTGDFKCPCTHPEAWNYAFVFFFVPCVVLAVMGWAVSNLTWRIFQGCCSRLHENENGPRKVMKCLAAVLARSTVVPVAWVFLMFLDGNYFACMKSEKPCEKSSPEYASWKVTSQLIGLAILLVAVVLGFIVIAIVRCCDSVTYEQFKYVKAYREAEEDQLAEIFKVHSNQLAEKNAKTLIEQPLLTKSDWDEISVVSDSFPPLSSLDEWVKYKNLLNPEQ